MYTLDQLLRESLLLPAHNPVAALEKTIIYGSRKLTTRPKSP
ncbi:MAG: hypothetical protein ACKO3V_11850 [Pirellula sp.]